MGRRTEYIPYEKTVNVTEKRAPTDASVKLLNEFEEKAKSNIIETTHVKNNVIEACIIQYQDDVTYWNMTYHIKFKLNGKDYYLKGELEREELDRTNYNDREYRIQALYNLLIKKYSEMIAGELLKQAPFFDPRKLGQI